MDWEKIGSFGVDSGQVLITDPCYLHDWKDGDFDEKSVEVKSIKKSGIYPYSYVGACVRTLSDAEGGAIGLGCDGVAVSSGYGDGTYDVWVRRAGGKIKELKVVFF